MILSRPVKPRARRTALITASVPELTSRTFSTEGTAATIFWASRTSASVLAPNDVPRAGGLGDGPHNARRRVPEDQRPPGQDVVNVAVAVHIEDVRPLAPLHEQRVAADALERPHRRVDPAGDDAQRLGIQPSGSGMGGQDTVRSSSLRPVLTRPWGDAAPAVAPPGDPPPLASGPWGAARVGPAYSQRLSCPRCHLPRPSTVPSKNAQAAPGRCPGESGRTITKSRAASS